eukprot:6751027-Prorocentrum_lima.AAC.1
MESALWDDRKSIWSTAPSLGGLADDMLQRYFHDRNLQGSPAMPGHTQLQILILGMKNSAPGIGA